ncbi:MAG: nucleotidyltransferase domain-containing protein [Bacteroidetes bacterium]|nr:nucleotidyltransferase domain-containing protein [Bacteroidota bacterium]
MSDKKLKQLLEELQKELKLLLKDKLNKIILYGSYANKTFDEESDVDIMVLTSLSDYEIKKVYEHIDELSSKLSLKYEVLISILVKSAEKFYNYSDILPFYKNVLKEGVAVYG